MTFEEWWKMEGFSKPDAPFAAEAWEAATMAERERIAKKVDEWTGLDLLAEEIRSGEG